jgi:hypothetical protein
MAYISQDPNQNQEANTTNVLAPTATPTLPASAPSESNTVPVSTSAPSAGYVSNGNPYGKYGTPNTPQQAPAGISASSRKTSAGPSSGLQTNVQTYAEKNKASSQGLGSAVAGKLQTSSDLAKQNLAKVEQKFEQGMDVGSLANRQGAVQEAQTAFTEAATATGPSKTFKENTASLYMPTKTAEGAYSAEDQALIDANKAKVTYGDGSTKEFADAATAQADIDSYNRLNPGYYTYGQDETLNKNKDRLSEILNAKYQGPQELSEISGFGDASNKIQDVSTLQKQALGGGPKEELLKRTFETQTGEYGKGARLLDDLLLGQGKAAETLKGTAEKLGATPTGKIGDEFNSRIKDARIQAAQRTGEIDQVKNEARKALTETAAGRSKEVNQRIEGVIKDWDKYPNYFKERFQGELEKHNVASEKKNQFDAVVNKYGGAEAAKATLANIETNMPTLQDFNPNAAIANYQQIQEFNKAQAILNGEYKATSNQEQLSNERWAQQMVANTNIEALQDRLIKDQQTAQALDPNFNIENVVKTIEDGTNQNTANRTAANNSLIYLQQKADATRNTATSLRQDMPKIQELEQFASYDPNALDVKLSQLEAEALGVQGGEGLYNILKEQGVDGLIKTAAADKNKLIGNDEQAQLARLQSIAELAKDYGVQGSGVNVVNQFGNRDLAGQQTALSALDTENLKKQLQGAEKTFRTDAAGSNISGSGYGTGSSGGWLGVKNAQAWKSLNQNFGDLLNKSGATRNMYSDAGVNNDLLKQVTQQAKGAQSFSAGENVGGDLIGTATNIASAPGDMLAGLLGNTTGMSQNATKLALLSNPVTAPLALASIFGNAIGGSSAEAQGRADQAAYSNAVANLQGNLQNKINTSGLKNQLSVGKNAQQDMELFKLLGLLDTTNL